jgi:hypothetical protein
MNGTQGQGKKDSAPLALSYFMQSLQVCLAVFEAALVLVSLQQSELLALPLLPFAAKRLATLAAAKRLDTQCHQFALALKACCDSPAFPSLLVAPYPAPDLWRSETLGYTHDAVDSLWCRFCEYSTLPLEGFSAFFFPFLPILFSDP